MSELFDSLNFSTPSCSASQSQSRVYWHASPAPSLLPASSPLGTQAFVGELRRVGSPVSVGGKRRACDPPRLLLGELQDSSPESRARRVMDAGHTGRLRSRSTDVSQDDDSPAASGVGVPRRRRRKRKTAEATCTQILADLSAAIEHSLDRDTLDPPHCPSTPSRPAQQNENLPPLQALAPVPALALAMAPASASLNSNSSCSTGSRDRGPATPSSTEPSSARASAKPSPSRQTSPPVLRPRRALAPINKTSPAAAPKVQAPSPTASQRLLRTRQPGLPRSQRIPPAITASVSVSRRSPSAPFRPPQRRTAATTATAATVSAPPRCQLGSDDSFGLDDADDAAFDCLANQLGM